MPIELEIVGPEKLLLSRPVDMVVIPAAEGDMGVLPGQAPMIVLLRGGVVRLFQGETITDQLYVSGGFADVAAERIVVLATDLTPVAEVSLADAERRFAAAKAEYEATKITDVPSEDAAIDKLLAAGARVDAAKAP